MDFSISGIKNQILMGYQYAAEKAGELAGRTYKLLQPGLEFVRQDARLSAATIAVSQILFIEVALLVATLTDYLLSKVIGADSQLKTRTISFKKFTVLIAGASVLYGMNVALAKGLQSKFSAMAYVAISAGSCASYIFFRLWLVSKQKADERAEDAK